MCYALVMALRCADATEGMQMVSTDKAIILARKHVGNGASMESSARLCLADAINLQADGDYTNAKQRALKSLAYSVGVFHADYRKVAA
jgi:hypothetical protein